MSMTDSTHALWVAYGPSGVVGMIRKADGAYTVTMAGADASSGTFDAMEAAKSALHAGMPPGSEWPQFRQH